MRAGGDYFEIRKKERLSRQSLYNLSPQQGCFISGGERRKSSGRGIEQDSRRREGVARASTWGASLDPYSSGEMDLTPREALFPLWWLSWFYRHLHENGVEADPEIAPLAFLRGWKVIAQRLGKPSGALPLQRW